MASDSNKPPKPLSSGPLSPLPVVPKINPVTPASPPAVKSAATSQAPRPAAAEVKAPARLGPPPKPAATANAPAPPLGARPARAGGAPPPVPRIAPPSPAPPTLSSGAVVRPGEKAPGAPAPAKPIPPPGVPAIRPPSPAAAKSTDDLDAAELAKLDQLASQIDQLDYFEILGVPKTAAPAEIKAAFYGWSRTYHPDRFYHLPAGMLKEQVHEVFKKITEAYYFLRNDTHRAKYLADVSGSERPQKLRFTEVSEAEAKVAKKKEHEEQIGTHPKGRQFFQSGMADFEAGRWNAATRNFKMALTYEPQNARYKEKLAESQQKEYEEIRAKGQQFKIT